MLYLEKNHFNEKLCINKENVKIIQLSFISVNLKLYLLINLLFKKTYCLKNVKINIMPNNTKY